MLWLVRAKAIIGFLTHRFSEIQQVLNEREQVEPELGLTPEVVDKLRERIAAKSKK